MLEEIKSAVDRLIIFILLVSLSVFLISLRLIVSSTLVHTLQGIDFSLMAVSYAFVSHEIYRSKNKLAYCKEHWLFIIMVIVPLLPIVRLARLAESEWALKIFTGSVSQFLERLDLM